LYPGPSTSEENEHHINPFDIKPFSKAGLSKENRTRKSIERAFLIDTPVKAALKSEVKAQPKPVKRNRLFSDSQEISRKSKRLRSDVRRDESLEEEDDSEGFCIGCAEPYLVSRAPTRWIQCPK
jgi:hypothetical protein